jgi:hypothetical protein
MSRNTSLTFRQGVFAQETGDAILILVRISHPSLSDDIRVTSNSVDTVSNGETFIAFPFDMELAQDKDDELPTARLTIDNVSREITQAIRQITSPATVRTQVVRGDDPDTIEADQPDFQLRDVRYNSLVVEGTLNIETFAQEPFPAGKFDPARFPGLF